NRGPTAHFATGPHEYSGTSMAKWMSVPGFFRKVLVAVGLRRGIGSSLTERTQFVLIRLRIIGFAVVQFVNPRQKYERGEGPAVDLLQRLEERAIDFEGVRPAGIVVREADQQLIVTVAVDA